MTPEANDSPAQEQRLHEILEAYLQAVEAGQKPDRQELLARHPDLAGELAAFFADHDKLNRLAAPLRAATRPGPHEAGTAARQPETILPSSGRPWPPPRRERAGKEKRRMPAWRHKPWPLPGAPPRHRRWARRSVTSATMSCWRSWAGAAWGWCTRPGRASCSRLVALKMILAGQYAGPQELARFRSEAEAVARLQHPHIVQIYEVGEHDGQPYFSLEFVDGGSLAQKLDGTPLPPRQAARLVETLARAMHAAHQAGVVHRDLKPANVLLQKDEAGRMKDEKKPASAPIHPSSFILHPFDRRSPTSAWPRSWKASRGSPPRRAHRQRGHHGHAQLHGPGAGGRRQQGHRPGRRRLCPGGDPLRAADGPAAVPGRHAAGHACCRWSWTSRCRRGSSTRRCRATWRPSA